MALFGHPPLLNSLDILPQDGIISHNDKVTYGQHHISREEMACDAAVRGIRTYGLWANPW